MTLLLTGASGFVGRAVLQSLQQRGVQVKPVFRTQASAQSVGAVDTACIVPTLDVATQWGQALECVSVIIHAAARAHIMQDDAIDPLTEYRRINVDGTLALAHQAAQAGVRRFIFISSIKVNGESTRTGKPFTEECIPSPEDAYGISKLEAEQGLQQIAAATGMEVVIIRPPLVYGAGVKGNLLSLLRLAKSGLPVPLGMIHNQRSMVYLENLADLIVTCVDAPAAANQIFLVSDARDLSTSDLFSLLRREMGVPRRLLPIPPWALNVLGRLTGKRAMIDRLCGSLQVDCSKAHRMLGWEPPCSVEYGLSEMVKSFMNAG